jgi:hypothetical protein
LVVLANGRLVEPSHITTSRHRDTTPITPITPTHIRSQDAYAIPAIIVDVQVTAQRARGMSEQQALQVPARKSRQSLPGRGLSVP